MNYKNLLLIFCCTVCINCKSQNIGYNKQHENFLNWFLKQRSEKIVSKKTALLNTGYINYLLEGTNFSNKDSIGFIKQINESNSFLYSYTTFSKKTFIEDSVIHTLSINPSHLFLKISKPIFFHNKDRVWIFVEEYCGDLCGSGMIEVYKKTKSGYVLLFKKLIWISQISTLHRFLFLA